MEVHTAPQVSIKELWVTSVQAVWSSRPWWRDSRFGCGRSRVQFPPGPVLIVQAIFVFSVQNNFDINVFYGFRQNGAKRELNPRPLLP